MPIDTSIYGQIKPVQIESPLNALMQVSQVQGAQRQNKLAELALGQKEREIDFQGKRRNALASALNLETGQLDDAAYTKGLAGIGDYEGLQSHRTSQAAQQKAQREAETAALQQAIEKQKVIAQYAGAAKDQASWSQGLAALQSMGVDVSQVPQQFDPQTAAILRDRSMTGVQQLEQKWKALDVAYRASNDSANRNVTVRGQNLTDARGRRANDLKAEENSINQQGIVGKKIQDVELKLQDDYRAESKGFSETATAMKKVLGAISTADKNPGSALAAGTAFMKLLDPNSVVRESELGMALNASGWFDRALNIAETLQSGKVMTTKQQANLKAASETLFQEAKAAQREIDAAYEQRAKAYGADPSRVIVDRGQRAGAKPATDDKQGPDIDALLKKYGG